MISNAERWRLVTEVIFSLFEAIQIEDGEARRWNLQEAEQDLNRLLEMVPELDENGKLFIRKEIK